MTPTPDAPSPLLRRLHTIFTRPDAHDPFRRTPRTGLVVVLLVLVAASIAGVVAVQRRAAAPQPPLLSYTELTQLMPKRLVSVVSLNAAGTVLTAALAEPIVVEGQQASTVRVAVPAGTLTASDFDRWAKMGVRVAADLPEQPTDPLLLQGVMVAILVLAVAILIRVQRAGGLTARMFTVVPPSRTLTMASVGGARDAQADLQDVIAYLRDPKRFAAMGAKCPKGVLLQGVPGTGKTLLARAVAGEAGCPVIMAAGSDFNEMFVGVGARRVRELAHQARALAPCIVFVDEFDSLGGKRGRPNRSGEEETTLNQLLSEMDGMEGTEGVIWMAATNREDMLDDAVRRPGRFDRVVEVGLPTAVDRLEILRIHAAGKPLDEEVDLAALARVTPGFSGADLANLLNEAAIAAVRTRAPLIMQAHLEEARDRLMLGRLRSGIAPSDTERATIAIHEAGHVVVGLLTVPDERVHKVTIQPRGRSLGAAHFAPDGERHLYAKDYLEGAIAKTLGGRAAELAFFGPTRVTSGAAGDLTQATTIARRMVLEFGMSDALGLVSTTGADGQQMPMSADMTARADAAVRDILDAQWEVARNVMVQFRPAVEAMAQALLEHETLDAEQIYAIADSWGVPFRGGSKRAITVTAPSGYSRPQQQSVQLEDVQEPAAEPVEV